MDLHEEGMSPCKSSNSQTLQHSHADFIGPSERNLAT